MDTVRDASLAQALAHLSDADHVFIRLALSRSGSVDAHTEFRSLVVDVIPKVWLDNHDTVLLAPWLKDQRLFECSTAFFYCGLVKSDMVREWFEHPDACEFAAFDIRPEEANRRLSFSLPEFYENVSEWHPESYSSNGAKPIPYPNALYQLTPKSLRSFHSRDDDRLVGANGDTFPSFRAARAELIYGVTDRNDPGYGRDDTVAIRVVDARGWLKEVRVKPDSLAVTVAGLDILRGCYVVAEGPGLKEKARVDSHHVSLQLPTRITGQVEVVLLGNGTPLDATYFYGVNDAHYRFLPSPYIAHYPHVIVEREDVVGYVAPATTEAPAYAPAEVLAIEQWGLPHPKVFISYSQETPEHRKRVCDLADRLIRDGVDCVFDRYETNPPKGWQKWMQDKIAWADHVLVVCTETYCRRFNGQEEPGKGLGAAWEGMIITQAIYNKAGDNDKFIPVLFSHEDTSHIPVPLQPTTRYMVADEVEYEKLYARLTRQVFEASPPLGSVRPVRRPEE